MIGCFQGELNQQGGNSVVAILTKILEEPDMELRTEVAEVSTLIG